MAIRNPKIEGRTQYRASGRVNWARFPLFGALTLVVAVILAGLLALLFKVGFYLVLLVPILASLALAGMVLLAVKQGHCRSPLLGAFLGLAGGIILYLGFFYFGMLSDLPEGVPAKLSMLPKYIHFRMRTEVIKDVNAPDSNRDEKPTKTDTTFNWITFGLEFGIIVVVGAGTGLMRSRKLYCERCHEWMSRETTTFPPEVGPGFIEALRQGSVQSLAALFTSPQNPWPPNTSVAVDYCPQLKAGQSKDCDLYLSIKQVIAQGRGGIGNAFDQSKGKMLANQILLNREEIAALLPRFTSLETVAGTTATEALKDLQVEVKPAAPAHAQAEVTPVEAAYAGKVLTTKVGLIVTAFSLIGILGVFVPIGLAALGVYLGFPDHPPAGGVSMAMKIIGSVLLGVSGLIFVANMVVLFTIPDYFGRRYIRNLLEREFRRRPKSVVSPTDSDAKLVQIVPRANWGSVKLFDCTDIGFLRVDKERRELLFEGDKEYYRVPAAAITSCHVETFTVGQGTAGATTLYHVVMHANHPSGFWEVPFSQRGNIGKFRKKARQKWALELEAQIRELMTLANVETSAV